MKCNQCGKEIPASNQHPINYNGISMIVCGKHYSQYIKYGHFLDKVQKTCFDSNEYEITPEGVWIYTFNRQQEPSGKFLIDLDDLELVLSKKWRYTRNTYVTGVQKPILIHRFLMNPKNNEVVDHINGDPTDNRRKNLRITTQQKNLLNKEKLSSNTTGITGVWWDKSRSKWAAEIKLNNIKCYLGRFTNKEDAAFARVYAEIKLFKEFRSTRNDQYLIPLAQTCEKKEEIRKNVDAKLYNKYSI